MDQTGERKKLAEIVRHHQKAPVQQEGKEGTLYNKHFACFVG